MIQNVLNILSAAYRTPVTEDLKQAWKNGLSGIPDVLIIEGMTILLQNKKDNFMPAPGELREICNKIKSNKNKKTTQPENIDYKKVTNINQKAKELSKSFSSTNKSTFRKPKLTLYEYINPKTGELKELRCKEHVNFDLFQEECIKFARCQPVQMAYKYRVWRSILIKDDKKTRPFLTYVDCDERTYGAEPVTVGLFI